MSGVAARALLRRARSAALATALRDAGGDEAEGRRGPRPYASLVTFACDTDASPILLLSDLSDHTRNLAGDDRACLLVEAASRRVNPQTGPRVSLVGRIVKSANGRHRRRFLARHPGAALYAGFADFNVYRMRLERAHFVGGFGRAAWLEAADVLDEPEAARAIAACEPAILADVHDRRADALDAAAQRHLARPGAGWRLVAVDPEGCDVMRRGRIGRIDFRTRAASADALAFALAQALAPPDA